VNILLVNVHSSQNAGDEALTQATIQQLSEAFPGSRVSLVIDDPASYQGPESVYSSLYHWVRKYGEDGRPKWILTRLLWLFPASLPAALAFRWFKRPLFLLTPASMRCTLKAYFQADLVVSKPGGFLYSSGLGLTLIIAVYIMALAWLAGKPLYIYPQSFGPFRRGWERKLVKFLLSRARLVMVREPLSMEELKQCGLPPERLHLIPDTAFTFPASDPKEASQWLESRGIDPEDDRPLMGMTVINWGAENRSFQNQERYEKACSAAARFFISEYNGKVLLLPQVSGPSRSQDDRIPARRIAESLADLAGSAAAVSEPLPPALLKALYGKMDLFVGTRMHSNIFALSMGTPVLAIGYQPKTAGIMQMLHMQAWVVDIRQVDTGRTVELLESLWENRTALRMRLEEALPGFLSEANHAGQLVAADYSRLKGKAVHALTD
jgi:colanic acid/amylovoran biosynthesis protein